MPTPTVQIPTQDSAVAQTTPRSTDQIARARLNPTITPSPTDTPTLTSTPTPTPTFTPTPTATPTKTRTPIPFTATPVSVEPTVWPTPVVPPRPLAPPNNETVRGNTTFKWEGVNLPPDTAYEVVWWLSNEDPNNARSLSTPTTQSSQDINVSSYGFQHNQTVYWAVVVIKLATKERVIKPSEVIRNSFVFQCVNKCSKCERQNPITGKTETYDCDCQLVCN